MKRYLSAFATIYAKDMLIEIRTKESFSAILTFSIIVAFIFGFAFDPNASTIALVGPGIVWVGYVFAGILGMNRAFVTEYDRGTLEGLLLAPISNDVIYASKVCIVATTMTIVEALLLPVFLIFFGMNLFNIWFILVVMVATVGFAAVGTLFAAIAAHSKAKEMLLPLLFLPISLPVIIGGVTSTENALNNEGWAGIKVWFQMIVAFDIVFLVLSSWAFEIVLEE